MVSGCSFLRGSGLASIWTTLVGITRHISTSRGVNSLAMCMPIRELEILGLGLVIPGEKTSFSFFSFFSEDNTFFFLAVRRKVKWITAILPVFREKTPSLWRVKIKQQVLGFLAHPPMICELADPVVLFGVCLS